MKMVKQIGKSFRVTYFTLKHNCFENDYYITTWFAKMLKPFSFLCFASFSIGKFMCRSAYHYMFFIRFAY